MQSTIFYNTPNTNICKVGCVKIYYKNVYLFCTHEGSGQAGTFSHIKNVLSKANVSTNGLSMKGTDTRNANAKQTVEAWLKKLKL